MRPEEISKRITEGELKLTQAIMQGHKPYYGDEYDTLRTEVGILRCLYFGNDSKYCNPRYKK